MAIGYGVAVPKGQTRQQRKARKDREDAKQLKAFRDAVWRREQDKAWRLRDWAMPGDGEAYCAHCRAFVRRDPILTGEVHHRISRRHKEHRYDPDNGVLLCNHLVNNCHARVENGDIQI